MHTSVADEIEGGSLESRSTKIPQIRPQESSIKAQLPSTLSSGFVKLAANSDVACVPIGNWPQLFKSIEHGEHREKWKALRVLYIKS